MFARLFEPRNSNFHSWLTLQEASLQALAAAAAAAAAAAEPLLLPRHEQCDEHSPAAQPLPLTPARTAVPSFYTPTLAVGKPVVHVKQGPGKIGTVKQVCQWSLCVRYNC